jgi:hypothetical protein
VATVTPTRRTCSDHSTLTVATTVASTVAITAAAIAAKAAAAFAATAAAAAVRRHHVHELRLGLLRAT